jgi:small basic protein
MRFIIATIFGILLGIFLPYTFSAVFASYVAVGILAGLDSVFGAFVAILKHKFDMKIFITGFFGNALMAILLTYIGRLIGLDIYIAAIVVFGGRLFANFAYLRRSYLLPNEKMLMEKIKLPNIRRKGY